MLLRRITQHVKAQNWFAVWIDFLIVVIGVFIGIQLGNWNERLSDDQRAQNYLARLTQDMNTNMEVLAGRERSYTDQVKYGLMAIQQTATPKTREEAWSIVHSFFQASHAFTFSLRRGTYDEIISSGDLGLLRDQNLVEALSEFYSFAGLSTIAKIPDYRTNLRRYIPFELQRYLQTQCYEVKIPDSHFLIDCPPPSPTSGSAVNLFELASQLQNDIELKRDLQFMLSFAGVSADIAKNRMGYTENVLNILSSKTD